MDMVNADAWVGRETVTTGGISQHIALQAQATLGWPSVLGKDCILPPLWHWFAFPTTAATDMLKDDGHPQASDLLPPLTLRRRMWAGGSLSFHRHIRVGEPLERRSRVRSIVEKEGSTGPMALVTLDHFISGSSGLAVEERQDIVFLDIPDTYTPPRKKPVTGPVVDTFETSEKALFRFSALTFNAHRIHYDLRYTQDVEHYPGLVVHGPLQAVLLMQQAVRHKGRHPLFFDFRGMHPMFSGPNGSIGLQDEDEGTDLWTAQEGHLCMRARAVWEQTQ
jgi:3-methylfumaryl-CoA hydratase